MRVFQLIGAACLFGALVASGISGSTEVDGQGFVRIASEQVKWVQVRTGIEAAILSGDPTKPGGIYVQRVKFSPGTFSAPHYHPEDRHVTVIKGTWYTGTGETFDVDKAVPLTAGSYMFHPAKAVHWDGAKDEEVIVQIIGVGPGTTIPVRP